MKNTLKLMTIAFAVLTLGIGSCKKDKDDTSTDAEILIDNTSTEAAFNDAASISDEGYSGSLSSFRSAENNGILSSCATITWNDSTFTVDFGSSNCLCKDGNYRRGKISVTWTGAYKDSASSHTITFDNYFVNDNQILGTKTVTNTGRNAAGHLTFSVVINGSVNWSTGTTSTYNSTRTREWSQGENTILNWLDDQYLISGTASGTTRNGTSYTMNTVSPLKVEIGFRYFTEGVLEFTPQGKTTRTIDYGYLNGNRDALAQVTVDGNTYVITLH